MMAAELAAELLPNGRRAGNKWMFSGIPDHGQSESAWVNLSGGSIGHWLDMGNAAPGEERGDMLDLLRIKLGLDQRGAFQEARRRLGRPVGGERAEISQEERQRRVAEARAKLEALEQKQQAERAAKAKRAKAMWLGARAIAGSPAEWYLRGRGLSIGHLIPGALRFLPDAWHGELERHNPAMVAAIINREGEHIGTHRIFIERRGPNDWRKLQGATAKMVLGNMWGGFIPINKGSSRKSMAAMPEGEPIYICEGPEDAIAIRMIKPAARIICAISLANIGAILFPQQARSLVIVADRDDKHDALAALERSIAQQQARGLNVSIVMPPAQVNGRKVKDINDWVLTLRSKEAAA
jgi:hypothetical protein